MAHSYDFPRLNPLGALVRAQGRDAPVLSVDRPSLALAMEQ
jgi:hypothetical protein